MKKQRLLTFIGTVLLPGFLAGTLCHADDTTSPLHLEYAIVVPHGNTINFYGVPVVGSTGSQDYDMEITLSVGADGTLHADSTKIPHPFWRTTRIISPRVTLLMSIIAAITAL